MDKLDSRLVQLELHDRRCLAEARRHRSAGSRALFRSRMLEHRRLQGQMAQLHRFKENVVAQFDALSNHELNRTFLQAMQGMVGASKGRASVAREEAETVMEDLQESISQVKELSEFLGQPVQNGMVDEITDEELESDFLEHLSDEKEEEDRGAVVAKAQRHEDNSDPLPAQQRRLERMLIVPAALSAA